MRAHGPFAGLALRAGAERSGHAMRRGSVRAASLAARRAFGQGITPRAPGKATRQVQHSKGDGRRGHEDRATSSSRSGLARSSPTRHQRAGTAQKCRPGLQRHLGGWAHVVDTGGAQIMRHVSLTSTIPTGHARLEHAVHIPSDLQTSLPGSICRPASYMLRRQQVPSASGRIVADMARCRLRCGRM